MRTNLLLTVVLNLLTVFGHLRQCQCQDDLWDGFKKDVDIQEAIVGIVRTNERECPIVLIFDEQMPDLSVSFQFMHRLHKFWRILIIINFSTFKLPEYEKQYRTNDTTLILQKILHSLYRRSRCYLFIVWLKDPRILYPETSDPAYRMNPGWRQSDKIVLVAHHITKRYKSLLALRFWDFVPYIIGVKRGKQELEGKDIRVFTVLPFLTDGKRVSREIDTYLVAEKKFELGRTLFFDRFRNLHKAKIKLGVFWQEPFFIWGTIEDPYLDGLDWRIFMLCLQQLNFTYNMSFVNSTGRLIPGDNGSSTWTGIMQMISDGVVDVGLGGLSVTSERLSFFDFCRTYYTDSFVFISPHSHHHLKSLKETLMQPLEDEVWIAIFISMFVGMITLQVVTLLQHKIYKSFINDEVFEDSKFASLSITAGFVFTVFCQKPFRYLPKCFPIQCVYYGTSLTIFILGMAFSSCLISVFLSSKTAPLADKVEDVLKTGLPISMKSYDGYLNKYMENCSNPIIAEIYRKAQLTDYFESVIAINEVVRGKRIHIDSKARVLFTGRYRFNTSNGMKFHVGSDAIVQFANLGWPCQKHWPLMSKFDAIISRAVESGLVKFWMGEFVKGKFGGDNLAWKIPAGVNLSSKLVGFQDHDETGFIKDGFVPLSVKHVSGVINLFQTGTVVSIFVFLVECVFGTLLILMTTIKEIILHFWSRRSHGTKNDSVKTTKIFPKTIDSVRCADNANATGSENFPQLVWSDFDKQRHLKQN